MNKEIQELVDFYEKMIKKESLKSSIIELLLVYLCTTKG
mgnify:CR=1 FL=1